MQHSHRQLASLSPTLCMPILLILAAFCLNWKIASKEGWSEGGIRGKMNRRGFNITKGQACFTSSLTDSREERPGEKRRGEGVKRKVERRSEWKEGDYMGGEQGKGGIWGGEELLAGACCSVCDGKDSLLALVYVGKDTLWSVHVCVCPYMCMCY